MTDSPSAQKQTGLLDGLLERAAAAQEFKVTERTVSEWCAEVNGLPHLRLGKRIYIPISEARAWIAARVRQRNKTAQPRVQRIKPQPIKPQRKSRR